MYNNLYNDSMPTGFGMALAANLIAYNRFSALSEKERAELMGRAHGIESPEEMHSFINDFAEGRLL